MWCLTMADTVLQSPTNPHFFQPLLPGFHSQLNIPVAFFSKHLQGRNIHKTAKLRSDAWDASWEVEMDGRRLAGGWKEFVRAHDIRVGDVLVFRHKGELVFHVTALGSSCCEVVYTTLDDCDDHKDTVASRIKPMKKRAKKNPMKEDYSSSDHSCFVANVTVSSLHEDKLYVPVSFVRSNGLSNTCCKIELLNEMGRSWKLNLVHNKKGSYLRHGWRSFCSANGINEGRYTFKLVRKSETPVIRLYRSEHRHENDTHSYLVGSVTPSSLRNDALYLSRRFVNSNGLMKGRCCEMILKNDNGGTWSLVLRRNETNETTVISRGWRSFCHANGLKVRDPFRFKLVGTGEKPVLQLCPVESNRNTSHLSSPCLNRFVTLTVTQYSVKSNKLASTAFHAGEWHQQSREDNSDGSRRSKLDGVCLTNENKGGRMRLGRGWKEFCEAHGVKLEESFVLELIWEKDASPLLRFCNNVDCV